MDRSVITGQSETDLKPSSSGAAKNEEDVVLLGDGPSQDSHRHESGSSSSSHQKCRFTGCRKKAFGTSGLCIAHGGGRRCKFGGCTKGARSGSNFCISHSLCTQMNCKRSARGKSGLCKLHGGYKKCKVENCNKIAGGGLSGLCFSHAKEAIYEAKHTAETKEFLNAQDKSTVDVKKESDDTGKSGSSSTISTDPGIFDLSLGIRGGSGASTQTRRFYRRRFDGFVQRVLSEASKSSNSLIPMTLDLNVVYPPLEEGWGLVPTSEKTNVESSFSAWLPLKRPRPITASSGEDLPYFPTKKRSILSLFHLMSSKESEYLFRESKHVKMRCIRHCSLFPQDTEFTRDTLVQLWIAEECIQSFEMKRAQRLEDVANSYFDALLKDEFIISSGFDNVYGEMKYKVNASKVYLWFQQEKGDYLRIDEGKFDFRRALHLSLHYKSMDQTIYDAFKQFKQLRTLVLSHCPSIKELPSDLFLGLEELRTLDLSFTHVSEVPNSVGSVKSLRYLDLSSTPVKILPESVDRLYLLQTLRLRGCRGVHALPKELRRLTHLRHLDFDIVGQLDSLPKGMGRLVKLQTLKAFLVGKDAECGKGECGIGELKNMNDITGSFCISGLENVTDVHEAKEAAMSEKKHIDKLEFRWRDNKICELHNEILKHLEPHLGLKELKILFYGGSKFPSWISNTRFTDLESITLYRCRNCQILPSIGELPSLKFLSIFGMDNIIDIKISFYREDGILKLPSFPSLEKFTLDSMLNLQTWSEFDDGDFPKLKHISIRDCPKLSNLPNLSNLYSLLHLELSDCMQLISFPDGGLPLSLESLIVTDCPGINDRCLNHGGEDRSKIQHGRNIWIDFKEITLD